MDNSVADITTAQEEDWLRSESRRFQIQLKSLSEQAGPLEFAETLKQLRASGLAGAETNTNVLRVENVSCSRFSPSRTAVLELNYRG